MRRSSWMPVVAFALVLAVVMVLILRGTDVPLLPPIPFLLLAFFTGMHLIGHAMGYTRAGGQQAVRSAMGVMAVKMFASMLVLALLLFLAPRDRVVPWALCFTGLYFAFLIFGTVEQFRALRHGRP